MAAEPPASRGVGSGRVVAVDLLRLVASFQMIQGHCLDALLVDSLRHGPVFQAWSFVRGLTSVSFLFAAGVSFHLATLLRLDAHLASPSGRRRRLRRGLWLITLGYLMHLPVAATSLQEALALGSIVDVLQCIGFTLLLLELLALWLRRRERVAWAAALLGALAFALSPWLEPLGRVDSPLSQWVSHAGGSIFPVVPWAGHMLWGCALAAFALPDGAGTPWPRAAGRLAAVGLGWLLLGLAGATLDWPALARLTNLGLVALVSAALLVAARHVGRLPRVLERLAGETLALYVFHVLLLYGSVWGLRAQLGHRLSLASGALAVVALGLASVGVALAWHGVKRHWRESSRTATRA